jgi:hypothetical protein
LIKVTVCPRKPSAIAAPAKPIATIAMKARIVSKRIGLYNGLPAVIWRLPPVLLGWVLVSIYMPPVYSAQEVVFGSLEEHYNTINQFLFDPVNSRMTHTSAVK